MKKIALSIVVLMLVHLVALSAFASAGFKAYGLDTVAGKETYLSTSKINSDAEVYFKVRKPDSSVVNVPALTGSDGVARAKLASAYTKAAGEYSVKAYFKDGSTSTLASSFEVLPGDTSSSVSTFSPQEQSAKLNQDAKFTVKITDDFGNPIEGHVIEVNSSEKSDHVFYESAKLSDQDGEVRFSLEAGSKGIRYLTAYDSTADVILDVKSRVAVVDNYASLAANTLYKSAGNSSGPVSYLEFEGIPNEIAAGAPVSLTVSAYDDFDEVVTNYEGEVRFSVLSDNYDYVDLPTDYTFTLNDQGEHRFSLAFIFQQAGEYVVEVRDLDDTEVFGEYTFDVVETGSGNNSQKNDSLSIGSPVDGTYSNPIQVISGKAEAGGIVKIYDNDVEIGETTAGVNGNFTYTTSALTDGEHEFYVALVNEVGTVIETSDGVLIKLDTAAPEITEIVVDPDTTVEPNTEVTVQMYVDGTLSQAALVVDGSIYDFSENNFGYYEVSFASPIEFGEYEVEFVLSDELGNETRLNDIFALEVAPVSMQGKLGDVEGLNAEVEDGRVILNWLPAEEGDFAITNYRVYYGESPTKLFNAVDTFTDATTWYVPGLENGKEYYFAVAAVDERGNISENFANIVSAVPQPHDFNNFEDPNVYHGTAGGEVLGEMGNDISDTGPEILWLFLLSGFGGMFYSRARK